MGEVDMAFDHVGSAKVEVLAAELLDLIHDGVEEVALVDAPEPQLRKSIFVVKLCEMCQKAGGD